MYKYRDKLDETAEQVYKKIKEQADDNKYNY